MELSEREIIELRKCVGMTICRLNHKIRWHEKTWGGKSEYKDKILAGRKQRVERLNLLMEKLETNG